MLVGTTIRRHGASNDDILRLFKEAQRELFEIVERMEPGKFSRFRREQLKAIEIVTLKLEQRSRAWAERELPRVMKAGAKETYEQVKGFGEKGFKVKFSGVDEEAVKILVEEAWLDFGTTMTGLRKDASRAAGGRRNNKQRVGKR